MLIKLSFHPPSPPPPHDLYCGGGAHLQIGQIGDCHPLGRGVYALGILHHYYPVNIFIIIKIAFLLIIVYSHKGGKNHRGDALGIPHH